ncbi:uncharacterized SAM-binding protein YcdF (DUF218 family) [Saccharothrix carnea]|uniref:Uncharacterized SAM-binding protein YcdF (DUF218 family) n=1 Tax=Saccharothrix carnea TaxID=1280637 RepID=A0A2P8IB30_SACCR|nr:uncharacterized SAM-binding protein YcdF (DUF218 family) [Saccharothrix carnea]
MSESGLQVSDLEDQDRRDIEVLWEYHVLDSGPVDGDFLLALGSHDLRVADHAGELYASGAAPLVVVTGGAGKVTSKEWSTSEAARYAERLVEMGVPRESLILEDASTNSSENFSFTRKLLLDRGIEVRTGIIVSKPYMARRARATAGRQWPEVRWFTRPQVMPVWDHPTPDVPLDRMINLMVGDLQRLRVYAEAGFQEPVDVPDDVWAAYERLAARGFDRFVIK